MAPCRSHVRMACTWHQEVGMSGCVRHRAAPVAPPCCPSHPRAITRCPAPGPGPHSLRRPAQRWCSSGQLGPVYGGRSQTCSALGQVRLPCFCRAAAASRFCRAAAACRRRRVACVPPPCTPVSDVPASCYLLLVVHHPPAFPPPPNSRHASVGPADDHPVCAAAAGRHAGHPQRHHGPHLEFRRLLLVAGRQGRAAARGRAAGVLVWSTCTHMVLQPELDSWRRGGCA